jgi:hypothetical protein
VTIFEGLMKHGSWSLKLADDTPQSVRDLITPNDSIVVTPGRLAVGDISRAGLLDAARWRGVILRKAGRGLDLSGAGMLWFLGSQSGTSSVMWNWTISDRTFAQHMALIVASNHNRLITFTAVGTPPTTKWPGNSGATLDDLPNPVVERVLYLAKQLGVEWRMTPTGVFQYSAIDDPTLWRVTPRVIVNPRESGRDLDLIGFDGASVEIDYDIEDAIDSTRMIFTDNVSPGAPITSAPNYAAVDFGLPLFGIFTASGDSPGGSGLGAAYFEDLRGRIDDPDSMEAYAKAILADRARIRPAVKVSARQEDPGRFVKPGDYLWLDDPLQGLTDVAEATMWRGKLRNPAKVRLAGMTWGVTERMGVYRVNRSAYTDPQIVDLSDWFVPEDDTVQLEVGALRRTAFD